MSIHVTVNGNPVTIRRGRLVLSDLDQMKKNDRDRLRRLRLQQVRQQSKEISDRLLERVRRMRKEELAKLERDEKSELRRTHDRKIMEMQQKFREDLEDIGQAHAAAALQPDVDTILEEEEQRDRAAALKRGKEAVQRIKEAKQKDSAEVTHQERLCKVREEENKRAAVIANLAKSITSEESNRVETNSAQEDTNERITHRITPKKKIKKSLSKKSPKKTKKSNSQEYQKTHLSPKPGPSGLQKQHVAKPHKLSSKKKADDASHDVECTTSATTDQLSRTVPLVCTLAPTKTDKIARYNPEDYTYDTSNTSSISSSSGSSSNSSISDDSSYFSDAAEQTTHDKASRTGPLSSKVQLYDHNTRQRNVYNRPLGIVERIGIRNEPNAIEAAQAIKDAESLIACIVKSRNLNAQRRGEDAILREKVRKDYQALMQNLDRLAQEERKLKASQVQSNAEDDIHMRLHQRDKRQEEHRKKLDRSVKTALSTDDVQYTHLTERVITLPTQKKDNIHGDVPYSTWQESRLVEKDAGFSHTQQNKDCKASRDKQLLDMLKKVERQKILLLQEFGASLPDEIFNSTRPLFQESTVTKAPPEVVITNKPLSPEIKVINMSTCGECVRKVCKVKRPDKSPTKKIEIAVQTVLDKTTGPAEDKGVQVELVQENNDTSHPTKDTAARVPHPIEPQIIVVTPETDESSNDSTSSEINGMVIEIDDKEVTVTPKKKKSGVKASKQLSPRVYQKIRSTSISSKATSPMKRFSRSQSNSRLTSPQKRTRCTDTPDMTTKRVDIHVSRSEFNDETDPSQETRISIDASAESSQTFSGMNDQEPSTSRPYRIRKQMKRLIRIKDTSDTSTSFASPPPVKPKSMRDTLSNITPILEMLDPSAPEEMMRLRQDISPVSTPETPSPRTMRMPSNIPHRDKISRVLRYNSVDSQTNNSTVLSSTQNDQSTLTDQSDVRPRERAASECQPTFLRQPSISSRVCTCKNPECKLLHMKLDDIHDYALKNCPEILQKYEDLQNLCAERIASLTDLIERVRSEQKDMDFSLISPSDETSLMQLPTSRPARNDVQAVRKLIESIEAVHAQLAKTLLESQKIIGNDDIPEDEPSCDAKVQVTTSTPRSKLVDTEHIQKSNVVESEAKPKIINNEKVNIQLNQFKIQQKPSGASATKTPERSSWPPYTLSLHEEEVIEKLSKEILEQSKNLDKSNTAFVALEKRDDKISVSHKVSSPKDSANLRDSTSLEHEKDDSVAKENSLTQKTTKGNDFVPMLSGISKIPRIHGATMPISARSKPPVTLLNGPYWQELESSGHELSTIVEFDTTDTANKSIKSPIKSKSMSVDTVEDTQKILLRKPTEESFKSFITVKPSVHVAPLPVQQNQDSFKKTEDLTTDIHSPEKLTLVTKSQRTTTICSSPEKKNGADSSAATKIETEREWTDCTLDKYNKQLQCNATIEEHVSQVKDRLGSSISTDNNNQHKNSQYKTTSTSLNSLSGLSGISEITSTPSSDFLKYASSPEEMETALKKLGLGWAITTLKKTREASALSSSSNSDVTPINTARRMISPTKKHADPSTLPDISDVSSISIKEASKGTEQAVLLKGRTSTPKFQNSNSEISSSTSGSVQEPSDSLTVPNMSLTKTKSDNKQLPSP